MAKIMDMSVWQRYWLHCWLGLCLFLVSMGAWAQTVQAVPTLTSPVVDQAQIMSAPAREALDQRLRQYAQEKGSQIQILTVNTTAPEDVFSYGMRVVKAWQLGREKEDDGVLLLIAKDDRKNQIFVGRGLEGAITDVDAHRILSETVRPHFQADEFDEGIIAAVDRLEGLIAGEALPEPTVDDEFESTWDVLLVLLLPLLTITAMFKKLFGRQLGSILCAFGIGAAMFWLELSWLAIVASVVGVYLFSVLVNINFIGGVGGGHYDGGDGGGGWSGGGDGGYSGGGGSFSGGGASGDW